MFVSGCLEVDGNISLEAEFVVAAKGPNNLDGLCKMMFYIKKKKKQSPPSIFFSLELPKLNRLAQRWLNIFVHSKLRFHIA